MFGSCFHQLQNADANLAHDCFLPDAPLTHPLTHSCVCPAAPWGFPCCCRQCFRTLSASRKRRRSCVSSSVPSTRPGRRGLVSPLLLLPLYLSSTHSHKTHILTHTHTRTHRTHQTHNAHMHTCTQVQVNKPRTHSFICFLTRLVLHTPTFSRCVEQSRGRAQQPRGLPTGRTLPCIAGTGG